VHVKLVVAAFGALNVPEDADHAYVSPAGLGPSAVAVTMTELPTVVSLGLATIDMMVAQSVLAPTSVAWPASAAATRQFNPIMTCVAVPAVTLNEDDVPLQFTRLSVEVPLSAAV
jgi:hypothetical protein